MELYILPCTLYIDSGILSMGDCMVYLVHVYIIPCVNNIYEHRQQTWKEEY